MIARLIIREDKKDFSLWDKRGNRLYYSDKPKDFEVAKRLGAGYYQGYWLKGVWQVMGRVTGYDWDYPTERGEAE